MILECEGTECKRQLEKKITVQLEEINQKILAKERRLKRDRQTLNNTDKTGHSKTTKENSINNWESMTQKPTNNQTPKKTNNFGRKKWQPKKHKKNAEWINNMTRELEGLGEGPKANYTSNYTKKQKQ